MTAVFCGQTCHDGALAGYHRITCKKNFDWLYENVVQGRPKKDKKMCAGSKWTPILFLRLVAVVLADIRSKIGMKTRNAVHPLQHPAIARMSSNYPPQNKVKPDVTYAWYYFENIVATTRIMMQLGVDIFSDPTWTPEVIQIMMWRMENNADMGKTQLPGKPIVTMININPTFLFMNHSCEPNVSWHGAVPSANVDISFLKGVNGEILNPGCSAVWCTAARDIKKGEELKVSYIGDPLGVGDDETDPSKGREEKRLWLEKWFERGCGCRVCEEENVEIDRLEALQKRLERETEMEGQEAL